MRNALNLQYTVLNADRPTREDYLTEEQVIKTWSIGEQEKYLSLEAEAAVIGKYIHEQGELSDARIDLMYKLTHPISVNENGRDTIIYKYTPTVLQSEVDALFFELQAKHRKLQAELNGMKKTIEDTIVKHNTEVDNNYRIALQQWNVKKAELDRQMTEVVEAEAAKRRELALEVQALKIVVPNRLNNIFQSLKDMA